MNYFQMNLDAQAMQGVGVLGLAHVGDAVYDLLVRCMLVSRGHTAVSDLHRQTVSYVKAQAQAAAARKINAHVNTVPQHAQVGDYHAATGLETLFGWLYLQGREERILELFADITEE